MGSRVPWAEGMLRGMLPYAKGCPRGLESRGIRAGTFGFKSQPVPKGAVQALKDIALAARIPFTNLDLRNTS